MPKAPPRKPSTRKKKPAAGGVTLEVTDGDGKIVATGTGANLKDAAKTAAKNQKPSVLPKPAPAKSEDEAEYDKVIQEYREELSDLAVRAENTAWEHASTAHRAITEVERLFEFPRERIYEDLAEGHPWAAATIKKAILTCGKLQELGHSEFYDKPASGYTQVCDILNAKKLSSDQRGGLLKKVYKHDAGNPKSRKTVQEVRAMIKDLTPPEEEKADWLRGTDLWTFPDYDPRFGSGDVPGRVPGQVYQNLIQRFSSGVIRFLNVGCGAGSALDVCKDDMNRLVGQQYRGVDIKLSNRVLERHSDHAVEMDCTKGPQHWDQVCPAEWADMVVVTLPLFQFLKVARTQEKTDLGNVIDPVEWTGLMRAAIAGAMSRLNTHGVLVVHSHSISDFERGEPVPDMDYLVVRAIQEHTKFFLAKIAFQVKTERVTPSPDGQPWLNPEAQFLHVYRKV